jgi:hypothetical protein
MKTLVLRQLLFALLCLAGLCMGVPVKAEPSPPKSPTASTSLASSKNPITTKAIGIDLATQMDIDRKLQQAGLHSKMNGTQLHERIEPIIPVRRENRFKTDYVAQHLHNIGVEPKAIQRFKKHRRSASSKGIYDKEREAAGGEDRRLRAEGRTVFDRHVAKIDFKARPQEAARQWWSLGVVGRTDRFGRKLNTMLKNKVVLGTHSQAWKDEFMNIKDAMLSSNKRKKLNLDGRVDPGSTRGQVGVDTRTMHDDASTSKTLPAEVKTSSP